MGVGVAEDEECDTANFLLGAFARCPVVGRTLEGEGTERVFQFERFEVDVVLGIEVEGIPSLVVLISW